MGGDDGKTFSPPVAQVDKTKPIELVAHSWITYGSIAYKGTHVKDAALSVPYRYSIIFIII